MKNIIKATILAFCVLCFAENLYSQNYFESNKAKSKVSKIHYYRQDGSDLTIDNNTLETGGTIKDMLTLFPKIYYNKRSTVVYYRNDSTSYESPNKYNWTKTNVEKKDKSSASELLLFVSPNPASDYIKIQASSAKKTNVKIYLSDVYGVSRYLLLAKDNFSGDEELEVSVKQYSLKRGIYLIRAIFGSETITKKVIIL